MGKITSYTSVTTLNEALYLMLAIDTDADQVYESRKTTLATLRKRLLESQSADGVDGFVWDTANALNSGNLHAFKNNSVTKSAIDYNGFLTNTIGIRELQVPLGDIAPTVSSGCAAIASVETTALRPDYRGFAFDGSAKEYAQFSLILPKSYDGGTITAQFYWTTTATDTDTVIWGIQGVALGNSDTMDVVYGTAIEVTDNVLSVAEDMHISSATAAVTIAGTPADAEFISIQIYRDGASDTAAEDVFLLGVVVRYTIDTPID